MEYFKPFHFTNPKKVLFALLSVFLLTSCGEEQVREEIRQQPAPRVTVVEVQKTGADVFREYPARIYGSKQVEVRARVRGILKEKRYQEGQPVAQNEILFIIDPEPYRIALRRAEAELADARAGHDHAVREWERHSRLYEQNAVSKREHDQALTNFDLAKARLSIAEAALDDARLNLGYTEVRSPVAGVTGMEGVSEGNLIDWGGLLTTITVNDPVHVRFSLPERDAFERRASLKTTQPEGEGTPFQAKLVLSDGETYSRPGKIDFVSSTIDPATGTVTARAVFPNTENELLPGQFVRIRVLLRKFENIFLIPERAVSQGPAGARVFVVGEEGAAMARNVKLGPVIDRGQVLLEGLEEGDRVVVSGHVALRAGVPVKVTGEEAK